MFMMIGCSDNPADTQTTTAFGLGTPTPILQPTPTIEIPTPTPTPRAGVYLDQEKRNLLLTSIDQLQTLRNNIEEQKNFESAATSFENLFQGVALITNIQEAALKNQASIQKDNLEETLNQVNSLLEAGNQDIEQAAVYVQELNAIGETKYSERNAAEQKLLNQITAAVDKVSQALLTLKELDEVQ